MPSPSRTLKWGAALALASLAGFIGYKVRSVAFELTDPPFYKVQPLEKVADTSVMVGGTGREIEYDQELVNKVFEPIVEKMTPKLIKGITEVHASGE